MSLFPYFLFPFFHAGYAPFRPERRRPQQCGNGCRLVEIDFEKHILNIEGSDENQARCAQALEEVLGYVLTSQTPSLSFCGAGGGVGANLHLLLPHSEKHAVQGISPHLSVPFDFESACTALTVPAAMGSLRPAATSSPPVPLPPPAVPGAPLIAPLRS